MTVNSNECQTTGSSVALVPAGAEPLLLTPITLRGLTARNRIVVSPMSQYAAIDGAPTDWHLVHLGKFAMGGAGIVFIGRTTVEERGRGARLPAYTRMSSKSLATHNGFLRRQGTVSAIQLGHAGRKVATKAPWDGFAPLTGGDAKAGEPPWRSIAPSPIPFKPGALVPREMDRDDIKQVIASHVEASFRSVDAGFDICEVHGAHGYIIQQFLSPITKQATGYFYGGDMKGRMRFALELIEAVRESWPKDRPLFFRASCVDGKGGAWDLEDTIVLASELKQRGVDVIDCSSGGIEGPLTISVVPRVPRLPRAVCGAHTSRSECPDHGGGVDHRSETSGRISRGRPLRSDCAGPRDDVEPKLAGSCRPSTRQRGSTRVAAAILRLVVAASAGGSQALSSRRRAITERRIDGLSYFRKAVVPYRARPS